MNTSNTRTNRFENALQALQAEAAIAAVSIDDQRARFWKKNLQSAQTKINTLPRECHVIDTCAATLGKHFGDLTVKDVMRFTALQTAQ